MSGHYGKQTSPIDLIFGILALAVGVFALRGSLSGNPQAPSVTNRNDTDITVIWGSEELPVPSSGEPYGDNTPAYYEINGNTPRFTETELTADAFESYAELDGLGRCGTAFACLGPETLPDGERGAIGHIRPTGWHTVKYKGIDGNYLYNRCHLIAFSLSGENDNKKNLITGTRYMNVEGMLPFEMQVLDYIRDTGNHVLYRVTPVFLEEELVARGVIIEAESVENRDVTFCVFCPNIQPGIAVHYLDGSSSGPAYE